jgi:hypothetical protein
MAEKRMFAKAIVDSDIFLEMPVSARLLYYDLNMRADDDGFVNSPKKIMRMTGATADDMNVLIARKYVIPFDSGIVVIRHWRINNYLRADRYHETAFKNEKSQLVLEDGVYYGKSENKQLLDGIPSGIPVGDADKNSIDKNSIDINSNKKTKTKRFVPPTVQEVAEYIATRTNPGEKHPVDPEAFIAHYEGNGWVQGKNKAPVKNWKACVITWEKNSGYKFNPDAKPKKGGRQWQ